MTIDVKKEREKLAALEGHTPGPWNLVWWGNETYPYPLSILADDDGAWIERDGTISNPADGRLIAAAPDMKATLSSALVALDAKDAEIERLRKALKECELEIDAWFDRRDLAHEAVDQAVLGAVSGYLRTCRVGGLTKEESDSVTAVISDMVRLSVFADLFARAALNPETEE